MTIASAAAFFVSEYSEAIAVMLLYQIGELLQSIAVNSSRSEIQSEFSQLNASNRENYEKLFTDIKIIVDGISNGLLSIKSDVLSDAQGNVSQVLESIKSLQNHIDSRVAAVEKDCVLITNGIASLHDLMSSEMSNIKENQANIQKTLNEVLYHSISFWKIKARKAIKLINQQ